MSADAIDDEWWLAGEEEQPGAVQGRKRKAAAAVLAEEMGRTKQKKRRRKKSKLEDVTAQRVGATDRNVCFIIISMQACTPVFAVCTIFFVEKICFFFPSFL